MAFYVSTHSRPKAAGHAVRAPHLRVLGFNTQPPEGGWLIELRHLRNCVLVSTHSRPKAAGAKGSQA